MGCGDSTLPLPIPDTAMARALRLADRVVEFQQETATLRAQLAEARRGLEEIRNGCCDHGIEGDYGKCACRCRRARRALAAIEGKRSP